MARLLKPERVIRRPIAVDPSGNVWVTDNAPADPAQPGSGGRHIVAFVGAAAPVAVDEFQ
jgi:hypothetical protein